MKIKAKFNDGLSWEKQSIYDLENGWRATIEYNPFYGNFIKRLDSPENRDHFWAASNGIEEPQYPSCVPGWKYLGLPEFARPWMKPIKNANGDILCQLVGTEGLEHVDKF
jgi:hypothetical protein